MGIKAGPLSSAGGGGSGQSNTISSDGGGTALTAAVPKVGVDLRIISLAATGIISFSLAADLLTIGSDPIVNADLAAGIFANIEGLGTQTQNLNFGLNAAVNMIWNVPLQGTEILDTNGDINVNEPFVRIDTFAAAATDDCNHVTQTGAMAVFMTLGFFTPINSAHDVTYVANFDAAAGYLNFPANVTMLTTKASMNVYRAGSNRWHIMASQLL